MHFLLKMGLFHGCVSLPEVFSVELPAFCEDICRPTDSPSMVLMDVSRPNSGFNGYP